MDNQYDFPELQASTFPSNLDITHSATFGLSYTYQALKVAGGLNWRSGKPITQPQELDPIEGGDILYEPVNQSRLEDYLRVDASILYVFDLKGSDLNTGFAVWNVFDLQNTLEEYYRLDSQDQIQSFQQQALGWTPQALIRWNF